MRKSWWFWLCFVVAVIMATYFTTRIVMTSLGYGTNAVIKSVSISTDSGRHNLSGIATAAGIAAGTHTYAISLDDINARISNVADVRLSAVRRLPNGNLVIKLQLHRAVALWSDGINFFPLSADGTIINRPLAQRPVGAVVFQGALPADISKIAKIAHNTTSHLDFLEWVEDRRWNIHTTGGITVLLPQVDPYAAISNLVTLDKKYGLLSKKLQLIDMRDGARILVK